MEIKEVLEILENNGYEAYIIGGYVRDSLLGISSHDVDIVTNAKVKDILSLFTAINAYSDYYGNVKIVTNTYNFDITTYRREKYNLETRKIEEIEYVDNLIEDLKRRDFIMNTLCMNKNGDIIDIYNGREDIENRLIRSVDIVEEKLQEDPVRALRAIRFASTLNFTLEESLYLALKKYKHLIETLPLEKIKEELTKILASKYVKYGLELLKDLGYLEILGIEYSSIVEVNDVCGMWSQLTFTKEYPLKNSEKETIEKLKKILEKGIIDKETIFEYGLYISSLAGSLLGVSKELITKLNNELPIQTIKDIKISSEEICSLLDIQPSKIIKDVYNDLKILIINNIVENTYEVLAKYICTHKGKWLSENEVDKNSIF